MVPCENRPPFVPDDALEVWPLELRAGEDTAAAARKILSPDEIARADRFLLPKHRNEFVICRAALRLLLGDYLDTGAAQIGFSYNDHGKPSIATPKTDLVFNLSHSGGMAVLVFGRGCRLGIDIERHREMPDLLQIATRFFAPDEVRDLCEGSAAERHPLFFNCWARKEAYVKAVGGALSISLNSFRVRFLPGERPAVEIPGEAKRWCMHNLDIAPGFSSALVYEGDGRLVSIKPWFDLSRHIAPA